MSLVLLDGCEDNSSVNTSIGNPTIIAGRNGSAFRSAGATYRWNLLPAAEHATLTIGFALRFSTVPTGGGALMRLRSDAGATDHVQLNANGSAFAVTANFSNLATSASGLIQANTWQYVEWQCTLGDAPNGKFTVRLNGAQIMANTACDTKAGGTKTVFDSFELAFGFSGPTNQDYDDLYAMAGVGDAFLGDIAIETLYPNGNGNVNQWIGSDGNSTDNYALVDEAGTPVLSDYIYTATTGHQDLYTLTDLVHTTGTVVGVCHSAHMLRTDSVTPRDIKLINRRAADTKSAAHALTTAYRSYDYALALDPETGGPFTIANVNALQSGVELA